MVRWQDSLVMCSCLTCVTYITLGPIMFGWLTDMSKFCSDKCRKLSGNCREMSNVWQLLQALPYVWSSIPQSSVNVPVGSVSSIPAFPYTCFSPLSSSAVSTTAVVAHPSRCVDWPPVWLHGCNSMSFWTYGDEYWLTGCMCAERTVTCLLHQVLKSPLKKLS